MARFVLSVAATATERRRGSQEGWKMNDARAKGDTGDTPVSRGRGECPPGHDPHDLGTPLEARLAEMRAHLARMRPASDREALEVLRAAFPRASLSDRVAVLGRRAG
jgi:hypothetical protein